VPAPHAAGMLAGLIVSMTRYEEKHDAYAQT
jgi:hypothetical protein